jgi:F-type H+-transporting ATPase subunit b
MFELDLPTIVFQIINFLLLAVVLGKFLFNPTVRMIKERERQVEGMLADAERKRAEAERLRDVLAGRIGDAEKEAEKMIRQARERMEEERREILGRAQREAEELLRQAREDMEEERKKAIENFREEIADTIIELSAEVVRSVVTERVHHDLITALCGDLWRLSEISTYRRAMAREAPTVFVTTPIPLSEEERGMLADTFSAVVDRRVTLEVTEDPSLIAGLKVRIADTIFDNSLRRQLTSIRERLGQELKPTTFPQGL